MVCDKLGLHLLMLSENMKYHFKYMDVINGSANAFLDDGEGYIDFDKYLLQLIVLGLLNGGTWKLMM